jgi:putative SOS response-associated peptidase YedK
VCDDPVVCGRFTQTTDPAEVADAFDADLTDEARALPARWNVAPTQDVAVVLPHEGGRRVEALRWGLVPAWASSPAIGSRLINARAETVATTPAFRVAIRRRRCLIPADGFYEWRRDGRRRMPFLARPVRGGPIAFAGLWSLWRDADTDEWLRSCAIVTTTPNAVLAQLHDRMPVVLERSAWERWLDVDADPGEVRAMLRPAPDDALRLVPVSPLVNDVRNEGARLVEPVVPVSAESVPKPLTLPFADA